MCYCIVNTHDFPGLCYIFWIWIWISNRQNLRWSITSMSVLRCLWRGAQLRLKRRGSYKEGVLVLLSIRRYVTELVVMLAAGSCICTCEDVIHWYCHFTVHYSKEKWTDNINEDLKERNMDMRAAVEVTQDREKWRRIVQPHRQRT